MSDAPNVMERDARREVGRAEVRRAPGRTGFNRAVHGARGLFAGAVMLYHTVNSGLPTWPLLERDVFQFALRTTEYGVELFFCISGFVIVGTLRRASGPIAFMEDRLIRIYPVLWATILVIVGLGMASGFRGFDAMPVRTMAWLLPANLLALPGVLPAPNFHPAAWSLSYELAFYGICALGWLLRRRFGLRTSVLLMAPVCGFMILLYPRAIFFLSGICVAFGIPLSAPPGTARFRAAAVLTRHPLPFMIAFLLLWRQIQELSLPLHINHTTLIEWAADWRAPLAAIAFIAATIGFAGIVAENGLLSGFLRSPALQFMGTISYSFYLWHPIVMSLVKQAMVHGGVVAAAGPASQLLFLLLSLPPALLTAWISQRVLERGAGTWLRHRLHHRASAVVQPVPRTQSVAAERPVPEW